MILNKLLATTVVGALTSGLAMAASPDPREVHINSVEANGSGCPEGSVAHDISADAQAFTLVFSDYFAEAGEGFSRRESRKSCQIALDIQAPQGWQWSLFRARYTGFADLERRTFGSLESTYSFQGHLREGVTFKTVIRGPYSNDYQIVDEVGLESAVWSSCEVNKPLNLRTILSANARGSAYALMTIGSNDKSEHTYSIQWRRCR